MSGMKHHVRAEGKKDSGEHAREQGDDATADGAAHGRQARRRDLVEETFYFGSEAAGVLGGVPSAEKGLGFADVPGCDLRLADRRKNRQSQAWHRNGRTDSLAKNASKKPRVLDLRVRSL